MMHGPNPQLLPSQHANAQGQHSLQRVYERLRQEPDLFVACERPSLDVMYDRTFSLLRTLGRESTPVAVATLMHTYALCALATQPLEGEVSLLRDWLLGQVHSKRWLLANTGALRRYADDEDRTRPIAKKVAGGWQLTGQTDCMSLASVADLIFVGASSQGGQPLLLLVPTANTPGLTLGKLSFASAFNLSDTRAVAFQGVHVSDTHVLPTSASDQASNPLYLQRTWLQSLIPAIYLGASETALHHLCAFARNKRTHEGPLLSDTPLFRHSLGELALNHTAVDGLCQQARSALLGLYEGQTAPSQALPFSGAAKELATRNYHQITTTAGRLVGTWAVTPACPLGQLHSEAMFGFQLPPTESQALEWLAQTVLQDIPHQERHQR